MISLLSFLLFSGGILYGVYLLRHGLHLLTYHSFKIWLSKLTDRTWKGILLGVLCTTLLQNSTAIIIVVLILVSVQLLGLKSAVDIVIGANAGAVIILEFMTSSLAACMAPLALIGAMLSIMKSKTAVYSGYALMGTALIFGGIWGLNQLVLPLQDMQIVHEWFLFTNDDPFLAILSGTFLSTVTQSMTTLTEIAMNILPEAALSLDTSILFTLGGNLGLVIPVLFLSMVLGRTPFFIALTYTGLNVTGALLFYPLSHLLLTQYDLASQPLEQIYLTNLFVNTMMTILMLPFLKKFKTFL
ncbi:Na/Pi cotransporter family protein [Virgibacillus sp. MSP4-1]|uniref:Na/Pi symporter n=1 Tax=Virgibacillus sp. MSP4-1 TaxID=2700081 RepID=UPI0003A3DDA7|nr:Na/Pi symporter [Virgibacillus sp. MSP4-1]QHS23734.1 Na/Pi cotransporter family protein [Virgibacillus sp. MSP4-1]